MRVQDRTELRKDAFARLREQHRKIAVPEEVTAFMTLKPGDVLVLGVHEGAPVAAAGQRWRVDCDAIGSLHGEVLAADAQVYA